MAVKMNLWSMTLLPGEKYPLYVRRDFQITNAALGEELRDESGRSVVKVTHNPIPPSAFDDSDDEFDDSEIDSDFEDDEDEFDLEGQDDDEEEDDEEEEGDAEAAKKVKAVAKAALKDLEADASMEDDDEEDDEDDEDMDSDDEDEVVETSVLCSLTAGKIEQAALNLTFVEGEVVMFEVSGENSVHLMGNYIDQFPDVDSDSEFDSDEDDYSELYGDEDDEEEDGPIIEELDEEITIKPKKAVKAVKEEKATPAAAPVAEKPVSQKRKAEDIESPAKAAAAPATEGLSKAQKKKLAKKAKLEEAAPAAAAPAAAAEKPKAAAAKAPSKRTTPSGLIIEDITVGTGPVAKGGKRLGMRYIGKLTTGKQFDANTAGKPFSFVLGRGEVIKGWDEGLMGMAVGGERRLTIPAALAYGRKALPGIPANSTLKFDVKLVSIN